MSPPALTSPHSGRVPRQLLTSRSAVQVVQKLLAGPGPEGSVRSRPMWTGARGPRQAVVCRAVWDTCWVRLPAAPEWPWRLHSAQCRAPPAAARVSLQPFRALSGGAEVLDVRWRFPGD